MEAVTNLNPKAKFFMKLDLVKKYWQMPLAEKNQDFTTFITLFGKYKYLQCTMGFVSTGDSYSYRGDVTLAGLPIQKVIDDIAGAEEMFQELINLVCDVLERCHKFNLTVNVKSWFLNEMHSLPFRMHISPKTMHFWVQILTYFSYP